jgi:hypothetical protein
MREQNLQAKRLPEALSDDGQEELYPAHKAIKEIFALGVDVMHEAVERLFVSLDEIDKFLNGSIGILCADYGWNTL